jgi:YidC/Oxa1 family membrane protein insertase
MTELRRTLLWVVFTMSLVLIWDAWNRHTGQPTLFGMPAPKPAASAAVAGTAPPPVPSAAAVPQAATAAVPAAGGTVPAAAPATPAAAATDEKTVVATDVIQATFSSTGGNLVRLELLKQRDQNDRSRNVVLFDQSAKRAYEAQSGLITAEPGVALPTHLTPMALKST